MESIKHIDNAIKELDDRVQEILVDWSIPLNEKDNLMLAILLQKKVLDQTKKDLEYLKANPPSPNQACGISKHRQN